MVVETYLEHARARVRAEREAIDAKLDAYATFLRRVGKLQARTPSSTGGVATAGTTHLSPDTSGADHCRAVRTAFAETIRPHSVADIDGSEPLLETMREEFTDAVAVALAPTTEASFTPDLKRMVLAGARSRRSEAAALHTALDREATELENAAATVDDAIDWLAAANETPLTALGFDALRRRHETLTDHRDRCRELARDRQTFLRQTTNQGVEAGIRHRSLMPYLYREFPVDHPVLATVATLEATCRSCQRAVRAHLVRRA